jgi:hypothetical protein
MGEEEAAAGGGLPRLPRGITRYVGKGGWRGVRFAALLFLTISHPPSLPYPRLYLLEAKGGIHELAGHMQALTRALEALKSAWCRVMVYVVRVSLLCYVRPKQNTFGFATPPLP